MNINIFKHKKFYVTVVAVVVVGSAGAVRRVLRVVRAWRRAGPSSCSFAPSQQRSRAQQQHQQQQRDVVTRFVCDNDIMLLI